MLSMVTTQCRDSSPIEHELLGVSSVWAVLLVSLQAYLGMVPFVFAMLAPLQKYASRRMLDADWYDQTLFNASSP